MAVAITLTDLSARALRLAASNAKDSNAARRMLAIALVLEGAARRSAAETCGMDRQTLRDWVHRFNAEGLKGLSNRRSAGPSPLLSVEQKAELAQLVREGPDSAVDGVVRWRCVDLLARIQKHTTHIGPRTFTGTSKTQPEQLDLFDALSLAKPT